MIVYKAHLLTKIDIWYPKVTRLGVKYEVLFDMDDKPLLERLQLCISKNGYVVDSRGKQYVHRIIMKAKSGEYIDHINGNRLDNRKSNLRICTKQENLQARHFSTSKLGLKGVNQVNKRFRSSIKTQGKRIHLGYFDTAQQAARAYDIKAKELFGEFAVTNKELL